MNRETARLKTTMIGNTLHVRGYLVVWNSITREEVGDLAHDALYAHALVQAISEQDTDLGRLDPRPILRVQIRADELMREWAEQLTEKGNG